MSPNLVLNEDDKKRRFRKYKNPEELTATDQCGTLTNNQKRQLMGSLPKTKKSKNSSSTISEKTDSDFGENEGFFDPPPFVAYSRGILVPSSNV